MDFIRILLETEWSPEQISNLLSQLGQAVSHEWIYRFVAQDKRSGGKLYRHLRQGHKRYRRGKKIKRQRLRMPYRQRIDQVLLMTERGLGIGKLTLC